MIARFVDVFPVALTVFIVIVLALQAMVYVSAAIELRRIRQRDRHQLWRRSLSSPLSPRISVLMPAYGEELTITSSTSSILALTYPNLEVVVINDGSTDATLERLIAHFQLVPVHPVYRQVVETADVQGIYRSEREPRLVVVDKVNGGKADALNVGLNVASGELVCAIDADTLVAPDALQQLVAPFVSDPGTVAAGGSVRLANDSVVRGGRIARLVVPHSWIAGVQAVEYARAFLIGRLGWNSLGGNLIISGAFGLFRRSVLLDIDGYEHESVGEDMELVVRVRRHHYEIGKPAKVVFSPDPVAWTECPESLRTLARQRNRWYRGLLDVLSRHRRMIFNPRYGSAGMLAMPYFLFVEALAPIVEALGILIMIIGLSLGWYELSEGALVAAAILAGACVSMLVLLCDEMSFHSYTGAVSRIRLAILAVAEQVIYRPLTTIWRLWGLKLYLQGRTEWGVQVRRGFRTD